MPEWAALIISGLVLLAVGAFITFLTKMNGKIDVLTERITRAEESTRPLTQLIQAQLMGLLHHDEPGYEEADALIDEFNEDPTGLGEAKYARLAQLMKQRTVADVPEIERERAKALLAFMAIVRLEQTASTGKWSA